MRLPQLAILRPPARPFALAIAGAWVAGALLRLWNLRAQILVADELHAVRAALADPPGRILFTYRLADNCIPLTLLDRLLMDAGVPLTEMLLRLPVLAAGLALLVLAPIWAWRRLGASTAAALAWLVAISPGLVHYSRIARSYAPATLFGCAAVAACERWHRRGGWRPLAAYVSCGALAAWFHLGMLPLVLSPLAALLLLELRAPRRPARVLVPAAGMAAALLGLLLPARATLVPLLSARHDRLDVSAREAGHVLSWLAGARAWPVAVLFWIGVAVGLWLLLRRDARLGIFAGVALLGHAAGILAMAPTSHQATIVLARYLLPALPLALLALAFAIGDAGAAARATARWPALVPIGAVALLVACGPFMDAGWWRTSFATAVAYVDFTEPFPRPATRAAGCYRWLDDAAPGAIVEVPWEPIYSVDPALALYQREHGREVLATIWQPLVDPRLDFRNMIPSAPFLVARTRARWVVVHYSIAEEEREVAAWDGPPIIVELLRANARFASQRLRAAWGSPAYRDDACAVWNVERGRERAQHQQRLANRRRGARGR